MVSDSLVGYLELASRDTTGITFIHGMDKETTLSYYEVHQKAKLVLYNLQQRRLSANSQLVLLIEDECDFLIAFWACLLGGIVAVPLSVGTQSENKLKVRKVLKSLDTPYVLCSPTMADMLADYFEDQGDHELTSTLRENTLDLTSMLVPRQTGKVIKPSAKKLAYLQFTSGSTGDPKGIMLTHENILTNISDILKHSGTTAGDSLLSWMPLTHDMGLIGFHMLGVVARLRQCIMPTSLFIRKPLLWIEKVSEHRITQLYSPNFGFHFFLSALGARNFHQWDLTCVRIIYNGAEPISTALCQHFLTTLKPFGLSQNAMLPVYGLAEASLAVSIPEPGRQFQSFLLHRDHLKIGESVVFLNDQEPLDHAIEFPEVGQPVSHCSVRLCNDDGTVVGDDTIGHLKIKGTNVTAGYYNRASLNERTITEDGWLRTGDQGFIHKGTLVITGRTSNVIIRHGRNFYAHDLERVLHQLPETGLGKVAVCGHSSQWGNEQLIIFVVFKRSLAEFVSLIYQVNKQLGDQVGITSDVVVPVRTIPKTTSGKTQYFKLLASYVAGDYDVQLKALKSLLDKDSPEEEHDSNELVSKLRGYLSKLSSNRIGRNDHFFTIGIDSLQAQQLLTWIDEEFSIDYSFDELMKNPTVHLLALDLQAKMTGGVGTMLNFITAVDQDFYDLAPGPRRLWLMHTLDPARAVFNLVSRCSLNGIIDLTALESAFNAIIRRHEILRAVYPVVDGEPKVKILSEHQHSFQLQVLYPQNKEPDIVSKLLDEEAYRPFHLETDLSIRALLVRTGAENYLFQLTVHHIAVDASSISVILEELKELYKSHATRQQSDLRQQLFRYANYIDWQERAAGNLMHKAYWQNELAGELSQLTLAFSRASQGQTFEGAALTFRYSSDILEKLKAVSRSNQTTLFMTLTALVNLLLYKCCRQRDIIIGTSTAGRTTKDLRNAVGCFMKTLPLRIIVDGHHTFGELLDQVKRKTLGALAHQDYSYEAMLEEVNAAREIPVPSLFNVFLLFRNADHDMSFEGVFEDVEVHTLTVPPVSSYVDLEFELEEDHGDLSLKIRYNTAVFDKLSIVRISQCFGELISNVVSNSKRCVSQYSILSLDEEAHLMKISGPAQMSADPRFSKGLYPALLHNAKSFPNKVAVISEDQALTFAALQDRVDRLAHFLKERCQVVRGSRVALLLPRSEDLVVGLFAAQSLGATYVPLDVEFPSERIRFILKDSTPDVLITAGNFSFGVPEWEFDISRVVTLDHVLPRETAATISDDSGANPFDAAYIIYTSGTTGLPKGVVVPNAALQNYIQTFSEYFAVSEDDIMIQQSSPAFDTMVEEIFPILLKGGTLVIARDGGRDTEAIVRHLSINKITILSSTPLVINEINRSEVPSFKCLRALISGGDELKPENINRVIHETRVYNTYGPSETTVCATYHCVENTSEAGIIGTPIANTRVLVADLDLNPQPIGIAGELCISGNGLANGYLNRVDHTADSFISAPDDLTNRVYRTGDIARWTENGTLEFLGRIDDQVKVNGYRVELAEIRNVLLLFKGIDDAVIRLVDLGDGTKNHLVAYIVSSEQLDRPAVHLFLSSRLPGYMLPTAYTQIASIPRTTSGKVDLQALPLFTAEMQLAAYVAPTNSLQRTMVQIWEELLHRRVGVTDNFFALGGNSLIAVKMVDRCARELGRAPSIRDIFITPTIAELSKVIPDTQYTLPSLTPIEEQEHYSLSIAQRRLWLLSQFEGTSAAYNLSWICETDDVGIDALNYAIGSMIRRHEILRTSFVMSGGQPRQRILNLDVAGAFSCTAVDVSGDADPIGKMMEIAKHESGKAFDLEQAPLLRAFFFRGGNGQCKLLIVMHHIVSDGWSMEIFWNELDRFIKAYEFGSGSLSPPTTQYKDFTAWHSSLLGSKYILQHKRYWLDRFSNGVPRLDLPLAHPRPKLLTNHGRTLSFHLSKEIREALYDFSSRNGTSLFNTLLAVLKLIFFRYTHQHEIICGTPVANRSVTALEDHIGYYLNAILLCTRIEGDETFNTLLEKTKQTLADAYEHQLYPSDHLIETLSLERDTSRSPLFDVLVVLQNFQQQSNGNHLRRNTVREVDNATSINDMLIEFNEFEIDLVMKVRYNTTLFTEDQVTCLAGHFRNICEGVLSDPHKPISSYQMLSKEEKVKLLAFTDTPSIPPKYPTVHAWFEEQVVLYPHRIAVVYEDNALTYAELNRKANRLSNYLLGRFGANARVALLAGRSERIVISMLAILKSGGLYVPVDYSQPQARIASIIDDAECTVVISEQFIIDKLEIKFERAKVVDLDEVSANNFHSDSNPTVRVTSETPAYLIYTSGSSGVPKGVVVTHQNVVSISEAWRIQYRLESFVLNLLQVANFSFDVFFGDVCRALHNGGRLIITSEADRIDADRIYHLLIKERISIVESTPSLMIAVAKHIELHACPAPALNLLIVGSDTCSVQHFNELRRNFGNQARLINSYGTTETTIDSSFYEGHDYLQHAILPIGKPMVNTRFYIFDASMNLVPQGVTGELFIGGSGISNGYWNRPDMTSESFLPDPFVEGGRIYRSRDHARWLPDGNLILAGRSDDQVKIRGYRVELGEIESVLVSLPTVRLASVTVRNSGGVLQLIAFAVVSQPVTQDGIAKALSMQLPSYMVPSHIMIVDEMPLSSNGKVDRKKLLGMAEALAEPIDTLEPPAGFVEEVLADIWKEVLGHDRIAANVSFFSLGGHSLNAMQVVGKVHEKFGVKLSIADFFSGANLREMASMISGCTRFELRRIPNAAANEYYPLSYAQEGIWILEQFNNETTPYHIFWSYNIAGNIDIAALETALRQVVERHESLRTGFMLMNGDPRQKVFAVDEIGSVKIEKIDLGDAGRQESIVREVVCQEISRRFDLSKPPLLRAKLFHAGLEKSIFVLTIHHIISDGWSMQVLLREIALLYNAIVNGARAPLEPLPLQFRDYVMWHRPMVDSDQKVARRFWLHQFRDGVPALDLPTDRPRPPVQSFHGSRHRSIIEKDLYSQIVTFARNKTASPFIVLMAAVKTVLYRYSGQSDIVIAFPVSGRNHADLENQVGLYVNTLMLRTQCKGEETFSQLVNRIKISALDAYQNENYPLELLARELKVRRAASKGLFDVMVTLQNTVLKASPLNKLSGVVVQEYQPDLNVSKYDLSMEFTPTDDGSLIFETEYSTDLFDKATIVNLSRHVTTVLENICLHEDVSLDRLNFLQEDERKTLITEFNQTKRHRSPQTLVELFEAQVAATPDRIALIFGHQQYTYDALDKSINQLARCLMADHQICRNDLVGLMMEPSDKMVIAIWSILKCGAAYVPVDPDYPDARKEHIFQDTATTLCISDANFSRLMEKASRFSVYSPGNNILPNDPAYVLYTSGTTGKPKGVMIEHHSVVNLSKWLQHVVYERHNEPLTAMLTAPINFDASVQQLFAPLFSGGCLVMLSVPAKKDPETYLSSFLSYRVDLFDITPTYLEVLLDVAKSRKRKIPVKYTLVGGELLPVGSLNEYKNVFGDCAELINVYGITEVTVDSTYEFVAETTQLGSIGKPIHNTSVYVLDKHLVPAPIGVPGEIAVAGAGVGRGYLNQVELTHERYIENPFNKGERMYLSGDIGRWKPDGKIQYYGRLDAQIKIHGYRIETAEIESVIMGIKQVTRAVVLLKTHGGAKHLVCYFAATEEVAAGSLRTAVADILPHYMVPAFFVQVNSFPVTHNGKLDVARLPIIDWESIQCMDDYSAPATAVELELQRIWQDVLKRDRIGMNENFFESGGNSLTAIKMVVRMQESLKIKLQVKDVFTQPTIKSLASHISTLGVHHQIDLPCAIEDQEYYNVSNGQLRLWIIHSAGIRSGAYNMAAAYSFSGLLDLHALEKAYTTLHARHEILRTCFITINGQPKQKVRNNTGFAVNVIDATMCTDADIDRLLEEIACFKFDLANDALFRVTVVRRTEGDHLLLIVMHHIIADGWSIGIINDEVIALYQAYSTGMGHDLETPAFQYRDFAAWQGKQILRGNFDESKAYWMSQFTKAPEPLNLFFDFPRTASSLNSAGESQFSITDVSRMREVAATYQVSVFSVLLAALKLMIFRFSRQTDITIGTPASGRQVPILMNQIGFYVNTLPIRTVFDPTVDFRTFLQLVSMNLIQGFDHQQCPVDLWLSDAQSNSLFSVMAVHNQLTTSTAKGLFLKDHRIASGTRSKCDLEFEFTEAHDIIQVKIIYDAGLFKTDTIAYAQHVLLNLIEICLADPSIPLCTMIDVSTTRQDTVGVTPAPVAF